MFDIERVKSLVESTINTAAEPEVIEESVEGVELHGVFSEDMCDEMNLAIEESVVDFYEFTSGASSMLIEAAMTNPEKVELLSEAAKVGIGQRVKEFFTKIANFFKALATKIASYFTAFTNMTKAWKKTALPKIKDAPDNGRKYKIHEWQIGDLTSVSAVKSGFAALDQITTIEGDGKNVEGITLRALFGNDCPENVKSIKSWVTKKAGADNATERSVYGSKSFLINIVETAPDLGNALSKACKTCSAQANEKAKKYSSDAKSAQKDKADEDKVNGIKNVMKMWSIAQKAITSYSGAVQGVCKTAVHESMSALNALLKGSKKAKDDKSDKK